MAVTAAVMVGYFKSIGGWVVMRVLVVGAGGGGRLSSAHGWPGPAWP